MGKLDLNKISLSMGLTGAAVFAVCYLLYIMIPNIMFTAASMMFHSIQMTNQFNPSLIVFIYGTILTFIVLYLIGALYVLIYNSMNKK